MRNSWRNFFRRLAVGCGVCGAMSWSSALCYAVQLAHDTPDDIVYDAAHGGWQAGDNGGFGFSPWNFDGSYSGAIHQVDDGLQAGTANSSTFNNIGTAWRIAQESDGLPRSGRGFNDLQVGQTVRMVIDNPAVRQFFKGYIIRFSTGGGNICYAGAPCTPSTNPKERLGVYAFEYFTYGNWLVSDASDDNAPTTLFDTDTAAGGMQIDFTLTGPESYELVMDPLGLAATYTKSGNLGNTGTGAIDWVEFVFFNRPTSTTEATDFYISSLEIFDNAPQGLSGDYNDDGKVDAADYVIWRKTDGTSFQLQNEVSGQSPGQVDSLDYDAWRERFGSMATSSGGAVPEPGAFVYVAAGISSLFIRFRRG